MLGKCRTRKYYLCLKNSISLFLIIVCCAVLQGCFISLIAGNPLGSGVGDNKFETTPGIQFGMQEIKPNGKGYRLGMAYQQLKNSLGGSTAEGDILTPFFFDYIGNIYNNYDNAQGMGVHFTVGGSWYFSKLDEVSEYDGYGAFSGAAGLAFRYNGEKHDLTFSTKYLYYFNDEILDALDQDGSGFEIGILYAF